MYFKPKSKLSPIKLSAGRYWKSMARSPDSCYNRPGFKVDLGAPTSVPQIAHTTAGLLGKPFDPQVRKTAENGSGV